MAANGLAPDEAGSSTTPVRGARLTLALLLAINLFNYIDRYVLSAVEPKIRAEFLSDDPNAKTKTGWLSTAFLVTYMIIAPIFGRLGDRYSRWRLIGIGVIFWSLASGASGIHWPVSLASGFVILLLTRCYVGIGEAAYGPVAPTLISDMFPMKSRGRVLAWFYLAIPVGSALGFALGGKIANLSEVEWQSACEWAGPFSVPHSEVWRWAFYLVVPPGVLLGLLCFFMPEPPRGQADAVQEAAASLSNREIVRILWHTPSYVYDTLGMTAMTFAMGALSFWMPAYLEDRKLTYLQKTELFGLDGVTAFGVLVVVAGLIATLLGGLLGDSLRERFPGSYFTVSGVGMILGFPMVLMVLRTPFPYAWGYMFLAVFFAFLNTGPTNTVLANVTHPLMRSSAFAINIFVLHAFGDAISPPLIGWISDRSSMDVGFTVVSAMFLVSGLFWLWGAQHLESDTRLALDRLNQPLGAEETTA